MSDKLYTVCVSYSPHARTWNQTHHGSDGALFYTHRVDSKIQNGCCCPTASDFLIESIGHSDGGKVVMQCIRCHCSRLYRQYYCIYYAHETQLIAKNYVATKTTAVQRRNDEGWRVHDSLTPLKDRRIPGEMLWPQKNFWLNRWEPRFWLTVECINERNWADPIFFVCIPLPLHCSIGRSKPILPAIMKNELSLKVCSSCG